MPEVIPSVEEFTDLKNEVATLRTDLTDQLSALTARVDAYPDDLDRRVATLEGQQSERRWTIMAALALLAALISLVLGLVP